MRPHLVFEGVMKEMTFDFFGGDRHKIEMETLLSTRDAVFLDVRAKEEQDSVHIKLQHHIQVMWIPIEEVPDRHDEIPRDVPVGVFCSSGTRSTIVYFYLRALGYENVRIAPSSYDALTKMLLPGKLHKAIAARKAQEAKG